LSHASIRYTKPHQLFLYRPTSLDGQPFHPEGLREIKPASISQKFSSRPGLTGGSTATISPQTPLFIEAADTVNQFINYINIILNYI